MMTRSPARALKGVSLCSTLAIATSLVLGPSPAAAQAFEGTGTVSSGSANITTGTNTTHISIGSAQSVIDWVPTDNAMGGGAIAFQNSGTTATFSSGSDFAVLNRINVADSGRVISMNGIINSFAGDFTGGSVFFYSPSGFVIGPNAVINVGSLVLSASPIAVDGNGSFLNGTTAVFGQAVNTAASVVTTDLSVINALQQGSYVAMVAPRVVHNGTINVNGAAALVGAEAATINFRAGGLFDIQVDAGTTDANGVVIGGTGVITGPASTGFGDNHRAYLVAVPKNTAMTMLISAGSNLGFDIAQAADVVGNAIILSAGHDVSFGSTSFAPSAASGADANISQQNSNFTSALYGRASGFVTAGASGGGTSTFASDVSLRAGSEVELVAANPGSTVSVGGNLALSANADGLNEGDSAIAGIVELMAFGGASLSVTGTTDLSAIGQGAFSSTPGLASGDGTGGTILVQATTGSDMTLGGTLYADASGHGGYFGALDVDGGDGFGGTVSVFASGGSSLSVTGMTNLQANGRAGGTVECFSCGGVGGVGDGGTINVQAHTGPDNTMDFADALYIYADGYGGFGQTGNGGLGLGGNANFSAADGSAVTVAGEVYIQAIGYGGDAYGEVGDGGAGLGGNIQAFADGGTLGLGASLQENVDGYGGQSSSGSGGAGTGGLGQAFAINGGTLTVGGNAWIGAYGYGGYGSLVGGTGTGGSAYFSSSSDGSLSVTGYADLSARGQGGHGDDGDGGIGQGGHVEAYANNASLTFNGDLYFAATGEGGGAGTMGATSGAGFGGDVYLQAVAGGTVTVAQALYAYADGEGGSPNSGVFGGNGTGGTITVISRDGSSSLTIEGPATLSADGEAGYEEECGYYSSCSNGGVGQGGDIYVASIGTPGTGNTLAFNSTLSASANGYGGDSAFDSEFEFSVDGGDGLGGTVNLYANDGNAVSVAGDVDLEAIGYGGYDPVNLVGGDGTGGLVQITTNAAAENVISFGANVLLDASGYGGDSGRSADGDGGDGFGGTARVSSQDGTINIAGDLNAYGIGEGGETFGGTGGDGTGKSAEIFSTGGTTTISGSVLLDVSGYGGDGLTGGNGIGGGIPDPMAPLDGAYVFARNATITIGSTAEVSSTGVGGDGSDGLGGNGGNGSGGRAAIYARNADAGPSSVSAEMAIINADGTGGDGGSGPSGNAGGDGGDGGTGTGGLAVVVASAGNGAVTINSELGPELYNVTATALGTGGRGGDGGNGDGEPGGNGGDGGAGIGGATTVGTESGNPQALAATAGVGTYGTVRMDASATGGDGGDGNFGSVQGNGGVGGGASGGGATLLVRGSTVNVDYAALVANANGGDGGSGLASGAGGNATVGSTAFNNTGGVAVVVTERFEGTARGQLNAGTIDGQAIATGGSGSPPGASLTLGRNQFLVLNSDATIDSLNIAVVANAMIDGAAHDAISVINGDVTVDGNFSFSTTQTLSLHLSNSSLTADNVILTAGDFVPDSVNPPPGNPGTIFANTAIITTGNNFIADANIDTVNDLVITVPGLIQFDQAISDGSVDLWAQNGSINIEGVDAGAALNLLAATWINMDDILAGTTVSIEAQTDWINVGHIAAGGDVSLIAGTFIEGDDVVTDGNIFAQTLGGDMQFGNLSGSDVTLDSIASIFFGEIAGFIVNLNAGGLISGGNIDSVTDITAVAGSRIDLGALEAGGFDDGEAIYDGSVHLTAGWDISTGAIDAHGFVEIFGGGDIDTADIVASDYIDIYTYGGEIALGDLEAGTDIDLEASGAIAFGNVIAGAFDFDAGGTVNGGNIVASEEATGQAEGSVTLGNISAGIGNPDYLPDDGFSVGIAATGSITVGDAEGAHAVGFATLGSLVTGDLSASEGVMALVGDDMTLGSITTAADGQVYLANAQMFLDAGGPHDFDPALVLARAPVPTGGSITIGGPVSTDLFQAAAGTGLSTGAIDAQTIEASAGGTATIGGLWSAPSVLLTSNDIDIGANGGIDAGDTGLITLQSTNATQALIGDGLTGTGYALSNAEFGRISSGSLFINTLGNTSSAQDVLIGDLSITGPLEGSTIDDPNGILVFATGDLDTELRDGVIRVVGDVVATGFQPGNGIEFHSDRFELDAATGSIAIQGSGDSLGGNLEIFADRIHVASGNILDQLAANPQYDGYQDDLNAPAAVQRPGGVLSAANILVYPAQGVLIQNTGTGDVPAGFLANNVEVDEEGAEPGSIDLIVNGQLTGEGDTTTGVAVRDAFVVERNLAAFSDNSTINSCLLVGPCGDTPPPPPPPPPEEPDLPIFDLPTEVSLIIDDRLAELPFDEEDDETSGPIQPPAPLFDTGPLTPDGTVDEPISGSGNPALMGAGQPTNSGDEQ